MQRAPIRAVAVLTAILGLELGYDSVQKAYRRPVRGGDAGGSNPAAGAARRLTLQGVSVCLADPLAPHKGVCA